MRVLIATLTESPLEFIQDVSPRSVFLKESIKVPLILLLWSAGLQNALVQAFFKFLGEINIQGESILSFMSLTLLIAGCVFSIMQCWIINIAMKYYN
jgi:hypothetical protein